MKEGQRLVVVLPDSVRNYMTKFVDDSWMKQHGYQQADWEIGTIAEMVRAMPPCNLVTVKMTEPVKSVVALFKEHGFSQLPVLDGEELAGILTEADVLQSMVAGRVRDSTTVAEIMERKVSTIAANADSSELPRIFERGEVAIVVGDTGKVERIITKLDLIDYLSARNTSQA
jgi:cystathionine beta-synthase